jgi:putative nucleotidyltransferase with HDIG domain
MTTSSHKEIANEIINLLQSYGGSEYIGEPVTKLEHMIQSAELAIEQELSDEMVIAALLHDIGHICVEKVIENDMNGMGVIDHELIGANYLKEKGFSERIIQSVANHVPAKRYLCYKIPSYYQDLSDASKETLNFQGGIMNDQEAIIFEKSPYFSDIIAIRQIDDKAKIANKQLPESLIQFEEMIIEHLSTNN